MNNLTRAAARLLTGSTYALLGYDAWRTPGVRVDLAAPTLAAIRRHLPIPHEDERLVRGNAAVQTIAGTALALGILPRPAAMALIGSLIPTTVAGHAFWASTDPVAKKMQTVQFVKNMAMIGGLIFAAADRA